MAAELDTAGRGQIVSRVDPVDPGAKRGGRPTWPVRQIKMEVLAKLTGFSKRWIIELLRRLDKKNLIRTEGGSGTVKWIWRLPLGVPRLGKSCPTELAQKRTTSPGKAKAPRVAASKPKRRPRKRRQARSRMPTSTSSRPSEKPAKIPARRREEPIPSIPPDNPALDNPVMPATMVIPQPLPAPADPTLSAPTLTPAPSVARGPAPGNPVVPRRGDIAQRYQQNESPGEIHQKTP